MKVVLDTNILVSGTFWTGDSFEILKKIDDKVIILILSKEIIKEYEEVIKSEEIIGKISNKNLLINKVVEKIILNSIIVNPKKIINIVKEDPDDNKIVECATEGNADYIISYDNHLLKLKEYEGIKIITPKELLALL